ncbi:MAG: MFS transporter [Planctomycetota bacterium]|nr:MAG: MFS transporter [Planctomycetota bacterium]
MTIAEPRISAVTTPPSGARQARFDFWVITSSHALVDVFPMFITSLMIVLQHRLALSGWQETVVWVATPVCSGALQPLFAWLGDRYDTRLAGPLGLAIAAVCIGMIGFAQNFWQLIALQAIGVIGVGMYHPAAAAVAGQTGSRMRHGRAFAISVFIAAGMVGHTLGPLAATRVNDWVGMTYLAWIIPPALVVAVLLHRVVRHAPHRPHNHQELHAALSRAQTRSRWSATILLTVQNGLRFIVNIGLFIMFSYWAYSRIPDDPDAAAILNGNLNAAVTIGMGLGALLGGRLLRPGAEKIGFAVTAFGGAICVGAINIAGVWGNATFDGWFEFAPVYVVAMLAAVGFFAPVPASIGLGQRLLPSHTGLVTSLLMGVGWMVGALSRPFSSVLLGGIKLDEAGTLTDATLNRAFLGFAVLLVVAGVIALFMPGRTLREAALQD